MARRQSRPATASRETGASTKRWIRARHDAAGHNQELVMTAIKRILCPIDFSTASRTALNSASALAKWYDASLSVLYVYEPILGEGMSIYGGSAVVTNPTRDELNADVKDFVGTCPDCDVPIQITIEEGKPARVITATAERLPADLIVMGTHGRGGFEHMLLGSVTERVLRSACCPVLIVPPAVTHVPPKPEFRRLLCPVDFSLASDLALTHAFSLARETGALVTVLHVLELIPEETWAKPMDVPEYRRLRKRDARERLHAALPVHAGENAPIESLAMGKPYAEILRMARESKADLIVMGVSGHGAVERMFLGSTTNHVVRSATCPVMTVRAVPATRAADRSEAREVTSVTVV
jgi:nucleotide-binding universal stress UspA family protein